MKKILLFSLLSVLLFSCEDEKTSLEENTLKVSKVMSGNESEGFEKADKVIEFNFPEDHGSHENFKTEWWYFTGNLDAQNGREFGYQFTIFRTGLTPSKHDSINDWYSNQIYMGHFAIADIEDNKFYFEEKFSRDGNNLAGAQINPIKIWLEDWVIMQVDDQVKYDLPTLNIKADARNFSIDIVADAVKPKVLQGNNGLSQKGNDIGNASYYYSYTRLQTSGEVIINNVKYKVSGFSWMDREWSTSALDTNQVGWDWFSLQFNDNSELMYYQMRNIDGKPDKFSKGVFIKNDGTVKSFNKNNVVLNILDNWESPLGNVYPSSWSLKIPTEKIEIKILPQIKNQLMNVSVKYWEGSVNIDGQINKAKIKGKGYVELTGY